MADDPAADGGVTVRDRTLPSWVTGLLPLVLLAVLLGAFFAFSPLGSLAGGGDPLPDVTVSHVTLPNDHTVVVHVVNNGPQAVEVTQLLVNDAYWQHTVHSSGDPRTLAPGETGRIVVPYHWTPGWDLGVNVVLSDGTTVHHTIVGPQVAPDAGDVFATLAAVGLFVGVIPVALGMLWFPYMRTMSDRAVHAVLAFSMGVLAFLALDAGFEALELAEAVPGAFEGHLLVMLGALGTLLLVQGVSAWRRRRAADGDDRFASGLFVAYLVAFGIGLHNLAEGLAIGSAFAVGHVSLGAFLVVGFMLHNVTEGPAVVAPVASGRRPALKHFVAIGLVAGAPVILGGWVGSLAYSPTLGALFLAVGVGAIAQVVWELRGMIRRDGGDAGTALNLLTFFVGLAIMYVTDLFVAL